MHESSGAAGFTDRSLWGRAELCLHCAAFLRLCRLAAQEVHCGWQSVHMVRLERPILRHPSRPARAAVLRRCCASFSFHRAFPLSAVVAPLTPPSPPPTLCSQKESRFGNVPIDERCSIPFETITDVQVPKVNHFEGTRPRSVHFAGGISTSFARCRTTQSIPAKRKSNVRHGLSVCLQVVASTSTSSG